MNFHMVSAVYLTIQLTYEIGIKNRGLRISLTGNSKISKLKFVGKIFNYIFEMT